MALLGRAAGYPDFSSQGQGSYTPMIYSQKTLIKFYKSTVLSEICNTDHEGEIKSVGDKVIIRTVPDVTINDYVKGQDLNYESPDSASITLEISKAKYYAFKIDNIDELQNDITLMDKYTDDASERLKITVERDVFIDVFKTNVLTNVSSANRGDTTNGKGGLISNGYFLGGDASAKGLQIVNRGAASTALTAVDPVDAIMSAEAVLTEQDVPQDSERWIIIPTWMAYQLQTSDLRRADMNGPASQEVLRNGKLGKIGQFTVYVSNNLPTAATATANSVASTVIPFGHKAGLTFATQLTDTEMMPHPLAFGKIMRGLQVYGYKAVKPEALGVLYASKG